MKYIVKAADAQEPFNLYDSTLMVPHDGDPVENASLTLELKVRLNFVDATNPNGRVTPSPNGGAYAKDGDGWAFPIQNWTPADRQKYSATYKQRAEQFWSEKFMLFTPIQTGVLDYTSGNGASLRYSTAVWRVRPNVRCLFRLTLVETDEHIVVNLYNLSLKALPPGALQFGGTSQVRPAPDPTKMNNKSFRSDDRNYDSLDFSVPAVYNTANQLSKDTIVHEIGHALGQAHIEAYGPDSTLRAKCQLYAPHQNDGDCYGDDKTDPLSWNVMGRANRLGKINAISWTERIEVHTGVRAELWGVQMGATANLPPRRVRSEYGAGVVPAF